MKRLSLIRSPASIWAQYQFSAARILFSATPSFSWRSLKELVQEVGRVLMFLTAEMEDDSFSAYFLNLGFSSALPRSSDRGESFITFPVGEGGWALSTLPSSAERAELRKTALNWPLSANTTFWLGDLSPQYG